MNERHRRRVAQRNYKNTARPPPLTAAALVLRAVPTLLRLMQRRHPNWMGTLDCSPKSSPWPVFGTLEEDEDEDEVEEKSQGMWAKLRRTTVSRKHVPGSATPARLRYPSSMPLVVRMSGCNPRCSTCARPTWPNRAPTCCFGPWVQAPAPPAVIAVPR